MDFARRLVCRRRRVTGLPSAEHTDCHTRSESASHAVEAPIPALPHWDRFAAIQETFAGAWLVVVRMVIDSSASLRFGHMEKKASAQAFVVPEVTWNTTSSR